MKKTFLLFAFLLIINCIYGQNTVKSLVGTWQVSTAKTGSGLLAHYDFFSDGRFKYTFSAYDDRSRIIGAEGTYKLIGNKLVLYIKNRIEIVGGNLVQGGMGFQQEEIVLEGGKTVKVPQSSKEPIEIVIEKCKQNGNIGCMKLQNNLYYQISKIPNP